MNDSKAKRKLSSGDAVDQEMKINISRMTNYDLTRVLSNPDITGQIWFFLRIIWKASRRWIGCQTGSKSNV